MIPKSVLDTFNLTEHQVSEYLERCDAVFDITNGYAVRRGNVMHILAPQKSLSGRKLLRECQNILSKVHKLFNEIYAPIKHGDTRAISFVEKIGFSIDRTTNTHVWFVHRSERCA